MSASFLLQTVDVSKRFAHQQALTQVSIGVPQNSIYGLLGPNGAGKTTLIRMINLITGPDEGQLFFKGELLNSKHIKHLGYLPEERGLYKKMKVGEQALYLARLKGLSRHDALQQLKFWFNRFDIAAWWNRKVEELSKGMQQKVQFIITILHKPELLIFDEPFSGFDPINVNIIKEEILNLRNEGTTLIFSTHNMASVEELCDHIALINRSKKILEGSVKEIKNNYKSNTFQIQIADYQEDVTNNLLPGMNLLNQKSDDGILSLMIQLNNELNANDILKAIIPYASILEFHEVTPTMNDIFIRTVEENEPAFTQE
jgi:ABC-2 type transport system ATP-binding protein